MSVHDIITRIRSSTHDKQVTGYRDADLLGYINDGVRLMRRIILGIRPELLMADPVTGTLKAGETDIKMEKMISKVIEVKAGGRKLLPLPAANVIIDDDRTGEPDSFYIVGWKTVRVYPIPEKDTDYSITFIGDMELLDYDGASPFSTEIDDFLVEYAITRSGISNEFDVSQESSVMGNIISQVTDLLQHMVSDTVTVDGYWDAPCPRRRRYGCG